MPRQPRSDQTLETLLKKAGVSKKALKSPQGRLTRKDATLKKLRERSK